MKESTRLVAVLGLAFAAGCAATPPADFPRTVHAGLDAEGVQRADIIAGNYYFRPERVIVQANVPVALFVRKEPGLVPHTFVLHAPEAGIAVDVPLETEPKTIRFTPKQAGEYMYYCDRSGLFGSHIEKGMMGVLEVVEQQR
ncbi:MAG: cupredoxin domain-containing protein [Gammaproteobacteria bacterium]